MTFFLNIFRKIRGAAVTQYELVRGPQDGNTMTARTSPPPATIYLGSVEVKAGVSAAAYVNSYVRGSFRACYSFRGGKYHFLGYGPEGRGE